MGIATVLVPADGRSAPQRATAEQARIEAHDSATRLWFQDAAGEPEDNSVTIMQGETVEFAFPDGNGTLSHNVVFQTDPSSCTQQTGAGPFPAPPLPQFALGPAWSGDCRFDTPGVYDFFCSAHYNMVGSVVVEADPNATPTPSPTETPTPSATPSPTSTPSPTPSPTATASPTPTAAPPGPAFEAHDNFFQDAAQADPADHSVSIAPGDSVRFSYPRGSSAHNVKFTAATGPACKQTAGPNLGSVPPLPPYSLPPGWSGECRFDTAGVYSFVCGAHPEMTGSVVVAEEAGEEPTPVPTPTPTASPQAATPTPAPTPTPTPLPFERDGTPAPKPRAWTSFEPPLSGELTLARFTAGRLKLTARCASAGSGTLKLAVTRTLARRLRLKRTTLATAKATCDGHGRFSVTVKPNRTVKRALAHYRTKLKLTATLKLAGPGGQTSTKRVLTLAAKERT